MIANQKSVEHTTTPRFYFEMWSYILIPVFSYPNLKWSLRRFRHLGTLFLCTHMLLNTFDSWHTSVFSEALALPRSCCEQAVGLCLCTCSEVFWTGAVDVASDVMQGDATVVTMVTSGFRVVSKRESALMNCGCNKTCQTHEERSAHTIKDCLAVKCKLLGMWALVGQ